MSTDETGFQKRYADAQDRYFDKMVLGIDRRALEGVDQPVIHLGVITDTYKAPSDNLLMFRTKQLDPSYRESFAVANREFLDRPKDAFRDPRVAEQLLVICRSRARPGHRTYRF